MTRGVRLYLVGSIVLVSLAGCGRGFFQAEREPWRAEAEAACLKSGAVKESADIVRIDPISGPGSCGAEFPLKVAAIGEASGTYGFADEALRPPGSIGNQPRWPVQPQSNYPQSQGYPTSSYPASSYPQRSNYPESAVRQPAGYGTSSGPMSLNAPGVAAQEDEIDLPPEGTDAAGAARYMNTPSYPARPAPYSQAPAQQPLPRLGPAQGNPVTSVGPVAIKPTATLACPIVSELDRWLADTVQPSAMRWFGVRVAEIKQISAYSCRGMNGNSRAHISEHAFGNALDISAFVLADGRRITIKDGWRGMPEEQGFLRDVQAGACAHFTTVLAPGSNVFHYDHIHVDLMRRASRRLICQPAAVSGEEVASRAQSRRPYASGREPSVTGSLGARKSTMHKREDDEYIDE
ncbi:MULTISPECIES: extensin family protein [unclassified Bradyrhizobium]|uniref:extensin family protein n=1 Tax=unclassified Bradyrhizobium TaxID=2631580 RepID=UPI001CD77D33|nr:MULTISPECIES: extensin family protein [unclassified Bradyrhizobium]MCA1379595.1 extensin family protein [Bradyrhizobium sp. BRP05]MCA1373885.1 extensin family protein [Bradyrhizobium sp. IC4060]MCA1392409.1 extensin family protein [Bradyrhizobium sp. IC3123]MCA1420680.1 extensin family protein [Bradyrhizobium sp. BRP23]MCA1485240.1 extensin family protein [Bradyrhizobium sp. IC4061]